MKDINFMAGFESKEKAHEIVKEIQDEFDELLSTIKLQEKQLLNNLKALENAEIQLNAMIESQGTLHQSIKDIFLILSQEKDVIVQSQALKKLHEKLGILMLDSNMIKSGVIRNAK